MTPSERAPIAHLQVGRVIAATFGVLARSGAVILPLAILLDWAPNGAIRLMFDALRPSLDGHPYLSASLAMAWWLVFPLGDMAVVVAALGVLTGRRMGVGGAIATALALYPTAVLLDLP